jgi:uncharacterized protein YjbI with pentapeptide repeats
MANEQLLEILRQGADAWNAWREDNRHKLRSDHPVDFTGANLQGANLSGANLSGADLYGASLPIANLTGANLSRAHVSRADLSGANLTGANLTRAVLSQSDLTAANLTRANLTRAALTRAELSNANLTGANLSGARLFGAGLFEANLSRANLTEACLASAELLRADLTGADLSGADLTSAQFIRTCLDGANLNGCRIYGVSAWDVVFDANTQQRGLVITPEDQPSITVDDLEVAQFIYLLLNSKRIRHIIDTLTSKVVLILGRFTPARKPILDLLREGLRKRDRLPVIFDFDQPLTRDTHETITTLARMARYVIADITDAKSIPQELVSIVEQLPSVAVRPILQEGSQPWGMYGHIKRYPWVLPLHTYSAQGILTSHLDADIITPVEAKVAEIRGASSAQNE